ncbi:MAG: hypothetical protein ABI171_00700 [Collimonas sp.]|uniref:DUF7210 family protein n=1 Tax=Collimonas sp. TaxID=1963772 RepID=UPI003267C1E9
MKVTLKQPHEHAGTAYPAGAEIDVSQLDADWLVKQNMIEAGKQPVNKTDGNPTEVLK